MIDFACKKFKLDEIIKCGLGLGKADLKALQYFLSDVTAEHTSTDIAKKLKINLSTAQRSLKKLQTLDVITRTQTNFEGGGYEFVYTAKSKKEISEKIMQTIKNWTKKVEKEFKEW